MLIDIRPTTLPATPDEPGASGDAFRAAHDFNERSNAERYGEGVYVNTPAEFLASLGSNASERIDHLLAWEGGRIVGVLTIFSSLLDSTDVADITVELLGELDPAAKARLAEALVEHAHRQVAAAGRATIIASSVGGPSGPVTARTGHGGADPTHPEVAPLVARGYELEQVYRVSVAELAQLPDLEARRAAGLERASGYELVRWAGETPAEHRAGIRALHERMSTDAPVGGLAWEAEVWDEERLTTFEQSKQEGGRTLLTVAARHIATGELAGFSTLILPSSGTTARQHDTLVTQAHRGHGLGMLLKVDNMLRLRALRPELVRIVTWNAEENRPMLAVNEASGFRPVAYEAQWQWRAQSRTGEPGEQGSERSSEQHEVVG